MGNPHKLPLGNCDLFFFHHRYSRGGTHKMEDPQLLALQAGNKLPPAIRGMKAPLLSFNKRLKPVCIFLHQSFTRGNYFGQQHGQLLLIINQVSSICAQDIGPLEQSER